jgi:hypothetical protein
MKSARTLTTPEAVHNQHKEHHQQNAMKRPARRLKARSPKGGGNGAQSISLRSRQRAGLNERSQALCRLKGVFSVIMPLPR